jgi:hypothetical protein
VCNGKEENERSTAQEHRQIVVEDGGSFNAWLKIDGSSQNSDRSQQRIMAAKLNGPKSNRTSQNSNG